MYYKSHQILKTRKKILNFVIIYILNFFVRFGEDKHKCTDCSLTDICSIHCGASPTKDGAPLLLEHLNVRVTCDVSGSAHAWYE